MNAHLGPHVKHTRDLPCPQCGKPRCVTFDDGTTLCLREESQHQAPSGIGWLHHREADWRDRLPVLPRPAPIPPPESVTPDPDLRHRGLRVILDHCPVSAPHRNELRARGLTNDQIDALPFGSLPDDARARYRVAAAVVDELGPSAFGNVPGLYHDAGAPQLCAHPGLLISVEQDGQLVGITIRPNDAKVRAEGKYRHLSSLGKPGGVGSGAPCGMIFPVGGEPGTPVTRVIVTEGVLKGHVIANRSGLPVIAMPGATITADVPRLVAALGATEPVLAFDTDRLTNPNVAAAERGLAGHLRDDDYTVSRLTWPATYKGADDAFAAGVLPLIEPLTPPVTEPPAGPCSVQLADLQQRYDDLRELHSAVMAALGNKALNPAERIIAVMTLKHVAAEDRGYPPGKEHPIPTVRIAEDAGVSVSTATTAIKTIEQGLVLARDDGEADPVRFFTRSVKWTPGVVNQRTGEVRDINQAYYSRSSPSLSQDLRTLAVAAKAKPRAHGGKRTVCPEHPDAGVEVTTTRRCATCHKVLSTETRHEAPDLQGVNPHLASLVPAGANASEQTANIDVEGVKTHLAHSLPAGADMSTPAVLAAAEGVNTQDAHSVAGALHPRPRPNAQDAKLLQITFPSENVSRLVNPDVSHNDEPLASVGDAWLAGAPLVDAPPAPSEDVVLDPVRSALAAADHAHERDQRHRANEQLGARLVDIARSRGRLPVPKPPPDPPTPRSCIDGDYEVFAP